MGKQGGKSTSEAKRAASRENGKRGGRPKKLGGKEMKPGKYVDAVFTDDQKHARAMSRHALKLRVKLSDCLMMPPDRKSRADWHKRLDWYLDKIERLQHDAKELFPDVEESFTIASTTIEL